LPVACHRNDSRGSCLRRRCASSRRSSVTKPSGPDGLVRCVHPTRQGPFSKITSFLCRGRRKPHGGTGEHGLLTMLTGLLYLPETSCRKLVPSSDRFTGTGWRGGCRTPLGTTGPPPAHSATRRWRPTNRAGSVRSVAHAVEPRGTRVAVAVGLVRRFGPREGVDLEMPAILHL